MKVKLVHTKGIVITAETHSDRALMKIWGHLKGKATIREYSFEDADIEVVFDDEC